MTPPHAAPARWPALWFLLLALALGTTTGCALRRGAAPAAPAEDAPSPAFTLQVDAPDESLRAYLLRHLELQRFRHLPDLQASERERLAAAAEGNARELLATLGYFSPAIRITTQPAPAPGALPAITVQVTPGARTQVARADITLEGPADDAQRAHRQAQIAGAWSLPPGTPFTQQGWDAAKAEGLRQLQARSYPTARIADSRADIAADPAQAHLSVRYATGPAYRLGALQVHGSTRYDPLGAERIARLPAGADYSAALLLDAQQRLAASGYYDSVFLTLDTAAPDPQAAPVIAQVRDAPLQKLVLGAGLSTDSGARLSLDHTHNRLPGLGWRALSQVALDRTQQRLSSAWSGLPQANGWRWFASALLQREATGSYDVNSTRLRAGSTREDERITRSLYLQSDTASSQGPGAPPRSSALSLNHGWTARRFDQATAPTRGWGLALESGLGSTLHPRRDPFARLLLRWQGFVPLGRVDLGENVQRRSRLALRLEGGAVLARKAADIPVTQLFLTGGDTTVRGYGYRSIAARDQAGTLYGGRYLAVGSLEWQRPVTLRGNRTDFESAVFIDAGAVADTPGDLHARVGLGAGLRWRSPVGPLQADLAWGVQSHQLRLHLRLGFSF